MLNLHRIFLFIILCFCGISNTYAQDLVPSPNPPRLVVDKASLLSYPELQNLENKLTRFDDTTSNQMAVLIIPTLNGYPEEEYALQILRNWGIGDKKYNNGVLLLIAIDDRIVRIETGYGLEGAIPDITAKRIIDNYIVPNFRNGNYYEGIDQATDALAAAAVGDYKYVRERADQEDNWLKYFFRIIIVILILLALFSPTGRGNNRGGGMISRRGYGPYIPPIWIDTGGRRSGRFGGGGFGGGGFGGFGGGSGGGGGASGRW